MNIPDSVGAAADSARRAALISILEGALSPAFGAMPKRELELRILGALITIGAISQEPSVYELVNKLKVTRSRARALIYDRELRRRDGTALDQLARDVLSKPTLQNKGNAIALDVENPYLADHLRYRLRELNHASDGSFSPSLITISFEAAAALLEYYLSPEDRDKVKKALIKAGAPDTSLKGAIVAVFKKAASKIGDKTGEALIGKASEWLSPLLEAKTTAIVSTVKALYSGDGGSNVE